MLLENCPWIPDRRPAGRCSNNVGRSGQWERMEAIARELLLTMPQDADILNAVGVAVFQLERREEAVTYFRQALVNEPETTPPSHSMMGWYWARRKKFPRAETMPANRHLDRARQ